MAGFNKEPLMERLDGLLEKARYSSNLPRAKQLAVINEEKLYWQRQLIDSVGQQKTGKINEAAEKLDYDRALLGLMVGFAIVHKKACSLKALIEMGADLNYLPVVDRPYYLYRIYHDNHSHWPGAGPEAVFRAVASHANQDISQTLKDAGVPLGGALDSALGRWYQFSYTPGKEDQIQVLRAEDRKVVNEIIGLQDEVVKNGEATVNKFTLVFVPEKNRVDVYRSDGYEIIKTLFRLGAKAEMESSKGSEESWIRRYVSLY